jgi:hypothetical protein
MPGVVPGQAFAPINSVSQFEFHGYALADVRPARSLMFPGERATQILAFEGRPICPL